MNPDTENALVNRLGHRTYALLVRLRLRDQTQPARADDLVTPHDRRASVINGLQALEREGLLTRESTMIPERGKVVYYTTHVDSDPLQEGHG